MARVTIRGDRPTGPVVIAAHRLTVCVVPAHHTRPPEETPMTVTDELLANNDAYAAYSAGRCRCRPRSTSPCSPAWMPASTSTASWV